MKIKILASSSSANSYLIEDAGKYILIDAGLPFKKLQEVSGFKLSQLDFCLISHEHKDHCRALADLLRIGVKCGMSAGTSKAIGLDSLYLFNLALERTAELYDWLVMPFATQHDAAEPYGFLIQTPGGEKLCYATDTYYIKYNFKGVTHWMVECNYSRELLAQNKELPQITKDRIVTSHFELQNVKSFFKAQDLSQTKEIHLIHLSDENSNPKQFVSEIEQITGVPVYTKQSR